MTEVQDVLAWMQEVSLNAKMTGNELESTLLRGPFKHVMSKFLVPFCCSQDKVEVLRSNLYVLSNFSSTKKPSHLMDEENKETKVYEEWERRRKEETNTVLQTALKTVETMRNQNLHQHELSKKAKQELKSKIGEVVTFVGEIENKFQADLNMVSNRTVDAEALHELQEEGINLFRMTVVGNEEDGDAEDVADTAERIERFCLEAAHFGSRPVSQSDIVKWQKYEINLSKAMLSEMKFKPQLTLSEEVRERIRKFKLGLCQRHIQIYSENETLNKKLQQVREQRLNTSMQTRDSIQGQDIPHTLILKMVHEEQLKVLLKWFRTLNDDNTTTDAPSSMRRSMSLSKRQMQTFLENQDSLVVCLLKLFKKTRAKMISNTNYSKKVSEEYFMPSSKCSNVDTFNLTSVCDRLGGLSID